MQSPLLTCFFHKYLGADVQLSEVLCDLYDNIQFYFFHNNFSYKEIIDVEIFLRQTIKCDYAFMESETPVDLLNYFARAMQIEEAKKDALESEKREKLNKASHLI